MRRRRIPPGLRLGDVTGIKPSKPKRLDQLAGRVHAHACTQCSRRYCDACRDPRTNDRCRDCSHAPYGRSTWDIGGDPMACCRVHCAPATQEDMEIHRCAGDTPWWLCRQCHRTHPYDPTTDTTRTEQRSRR